MYFPIYCPSKVGVKHFSIFIPFPFHLLRREKVEHFSLNNCYHLNSQALMNTIGLIVYTGGFWLNINHLIKKLIYKNSPVLSFETWPDLSKISQICFFSWILHLIWISYYFVILVLGKNRFYRFLIFKKIRLTPSRLSDPRQTDFELTHKIRYVNVLYVKIDMFNNFLVIKIVLAYSVILTFCITIEHFPELISCLPSPFEGNTSAYFN